jgi:VanZ family protein
MWILALLWMAGILFTSSLGQAVTPVVGPLQVVISKLGHLVEYAILGGLLSLAAPSELPDSGDRRRALMIAALIGGAFAAFDELRQSFVPGREPRVTDVLLDLASVSIGAVGVFWTMRGSADEATKASHPDSLKG